ncbi:hypothetical protein AMS68_006411 [Peltaster fructicola]|uniref:chitin synthase n=1 Tax=Peltaster fructicola TaxID=286661 RepID=A0A6H0Y1K7_9PEZI|nr:hypothetical protein AMS68_006411 [Peltaster fructicola]
MSNTDNYGPPPGYPGDDDTPTASPHHAASARLLPDDAQSTTTTSTTRRPHSDTARGPAHSAYLAARARFSTSGTEQHTSRPSVRTTPSELSFNDTHSDLGQHESGQDALSPDMSALLRDVESSLSESTDGPTMRRKPIKVRFAEKNPKSTSPVSMDRPSMMQRTYQPSDAGRSTISRQPSVLESAPDIPPPMDGYSPYRPSSRSSQSPTRTYPSPRASAEFARPPAASNPYEPADLNGSPRPGARYQAPDSPKRPLPPAPLFAGGRPPSMIEPEKEPDMTTIPIDEDNDDVFGLPSAEESVERPELRSHDSFVSESTFTDSLYDEKDNDLYGPAPTGKQARRGVREAQMATKEVRLINGELILECKIPTILYSFLPRRDDVEFTHMRYTAVTCDPNDFVERGYKLRQNIGRTERETELLICVTMYNENEIDFTRTMHGIMRNIAHFCNRNKSRTWGKDGWQKIVVCIISDGRAKVHPRTLDALAAMGCYQEELPKHGQPKEVTAHVYEYTTQVSLDSDLRFKGAEKGIVPCQMIFCLKEKNAKKLNSHRWFFNAFGRALNPNVCALLDVGTKPGDDCLYHLWKAFDRDSNVAGAAGEIKAAKGKAWLQLLNPLVASQNFEYKMSNILDKPLESVFGYITVLPGALSAYRYHALQNDETGHGPLSQYFKGETLHGQDADVFTANMYLAEDRILCWELVAKRNERWVLKYVQQATGETDVPDAVPEFISQRRRWLNGAFFAAVYSLLHFRQIWTTDHSIGRKILLHIEFVYQFISLMFTFFSLGNFYLTFYFIAGSLADPKIDPFGHNIGLYIFVFLRYACVLLIMMQFILSMGNRPQGAKKMFTASMIAYSVIMVYNTFAALYIVIREFKDPDSKLQLGDNMFTNLIVSCLSTVGLYFLMSFVYMDPWHMFTSSAQYFALLPSYICTLQVYAFCNAHDVTWGTKGDNVMKTDLGVAKASKNGVVELEMPSEQLDIDSGYDEALRNLRDRVEVPKSAVSEAQMQEDYYRAVRTYVVIVWLTCNAILAMAVSEAYSSTSVSNNGYLTFILWSVAAVAFFRAIGSGAFKLINVIHAIADGQVKFNLKAFGRKGSGVSGARSTGGWSANSGMSMPSWVSGSGSWVSGKLSSVTSMRSKFG